MGHDWVLLVEGTTEVKAVQQILRKLGKDHTVVIFPLGGSALIRGGVEQELAELARVAKKVAVLIDSERQSDSSPLAHDRQQFVTDCERLGFQVHCTERRAFENYLTEEAIKRVMGAKYRALAPFELLKNPECAWAKQDNWRIVREMTLEDFVATDIGRFLGSLT